MGLEQARSPHRDLLGIDDLEGLEETLEILSDKPMMRRLGRSHAEADVGNVVELTEDEALALVRGVVEG